MRRCALGAVAAALLLATPGCGGAGSARTQTAVLSQPLQMQVGLFVQRQLRARLHDRAIRSRTIKCRPERASAFPCRLRLSDGRHRSGTVSLSVTLDSKSRSVQVGFTASSNRRWLRALQRSAASSR
jgi:hypothetical protein